MYFKGSQVMIISVPEDGFNPNKQCRLFAAKVPA